MVRPPKNIQWWWSPQKPLKICNGLFTFLDPRYVDLYALEEDVLQRIVEDISRCYLIFHSSLKYLDMILSSFGDMILTRDSIVNLKTIVDHCPQNFENHRKTIGSNGWTPQKTFNGDGPTLSKPLKNHWRQWWPKKNINHSIALKNWPSLWSTPNMITFSIRSWFLWCLWAHQICNGNTADKRASICCYCVLFFKNSL